MMVEEDHLLFESKQAWESWLEDYHDTSLGVRLIIAKQASGKVSVTYDEALEVALCFGWIDSQRNKLDDTYFLQRFTPRRKKSPWSAVNRERAENLIKQGKMREAGLREIEKAQQDGRWDAAYQPQSKATVPDDLQQALAENEAARAFFETLDSRNRFAILYRLNTAKKTETRQRRLDQFIQMLVEKRKIYE